MGQVREVELEAALGDAIIATEKEIAGGAWGNEETDALDETGDRGLESLGEGLEGQHEADDEDETEAEGEDAEGEGESEDGETEGEAEGEQDPEGGKGKTEPKPGEQQQQQRQPEGRVPPGKLREANERARAAEAERDQLKADLETAKKAPGDNRAEIDGLKGQIAALTQLIQGQNRQPPAKTDEPVAPKAPDIFENPDGFVEHISNMVQKAVAPLAQQRVADRVETSMAIAHATHKDAFEEAFGALNKLSPQNPDDRVVVQRIYNSPNPGEELVKWHKRQRTLAEVGDDPAAFREKVKQDLLKDPEFRKQLMSDLRKEAASGDNGAPRTQNRLPPSLGRASGSNLGSERMDHRASDDSEQGVADAAWR